MSTTMVSEAPPITPDELLDLPDSVGYELVDGQLVERHMGAESSEVALRIASFLAVFLNLHRLGRLFGSDTTYKCFPDAPGKVRRADVGFVRYHRLPGGRAPRGHCLVAPDLAVEVISPNDIAEEVEAKVHEWLGAGATLVWVVSPTFKTVRIYRPRAATNGPISFLTADDVISGEDLLPGFTCAIQEFFDND